METYPFLVLIAAVIIFIYVFFSVKRPPNYPPGPLWWSFIGNLPQLKKLSKELGGQHLALQELSKQYNTNILGLKLGQDYVLVVFSYPTVRKVLTGEEYEGRPDNFFIRLRSMGTRKGVTCVDGNLWRTHRIFVTTHLRELGYGRNRMEEMIKEEIAEVLTVLNENLDSVRISKILAPAVVNILWALSTGSRFSRKDPNLAKLLDLLNVRSKTFDISGGTLSQHPWLRFFIPEKSGYNLIKRLNSELKAILIKTIEEHRKNWYENRDDDLVYSFLSEMKKENEDVSTFTDDQLVMICLDLFIAGSQTTSNTLEFAFMTMIINPDVQAKVHECIDMNLNNLDSLNYSDRHKFPYVQAVLSEVERMYSVAPICGPRRVLRDTILDNYNIPKDTTVLISLYSVHYDKEYWKDPEVFRPERFLDENGKYIHSDRVISFGLGRRRCLGEVLAKACIFLCFVEIMRRYEVSITPGTNTPLGVPLPGITLTPEYFTASFKTRS